MTVSSLPAAPCGGLSRVIRAANNDVRKPDIALFCERELARLGTGV